MILSIIVPVYNVEAYLQKCVDSLLEQDLQSVDYEIILVDDGSTDKSGQICDSYAADYDNVRVIHQQNKGLSAARNTGIAAATGEYIQFVDSDDYLCPNVLKGIVCRLESQRLDILRINYQNVNSDGIVFEPNKYSKPFDDYSDEVCDGLTFLNERLGFACYAVQFIVKASIIQQPNNIFMEGLLYEDVEWAPRILLQAHRVASSSVMVYNYLFRHNSISRNANLYRKRKAIEDRFFILDSFSFLKKSVNDKRWFNGMTSKLTLAILTETSRWFYAERVDIINALKEKTVFPLSVYHATPSAKYKIRLANLSPFLFCIVLHLRNDNHRKV